MDRVRLTSVILYMCVFIRGDRVSKYETVVSFNDPCDRY